MELHNHTNKIIICVIIKALVSPIISSSEKKETKKRKHWLTPILIDRYLYTPWEYFLLSADIFFPYVIVSVIPWKKHCKKAAVYNNERIKFLPFFADHNVEIGSGRVPRIDPVICSKAWLKWPD